MSCSKNNYTTYEFKSEVEFLNGLPTTVSLIEYDANNTIVATNKFLMKKNEVKKFTICDKSIKVKVFLQFDYGGQSGILAGWITDVFFLSENMNTKIYLNANSRIDSREP